MVFAQMYINRLLQIINAVLCESLNITLISIRSAVLIPFVSRETDGNDTPGIGSCGIELNHTGTAVVLNVSPCGKHGRTGFAFKCLHYIASSR